MLYVQMGSPCKDLFFFFPLNSKWPWALTQDTPVVGFPPPPPQVFPSWMLEIASGGL